MKKREAYQNLSDLIYKGFLAINVHIADDLFVFKTINEKEYDLIKIYSGNPNEESYSNRFNIVFIVFSLLSINGFYVLDKRDSLFEEILDFFSEMPSPLRNKIITELNKLRKESYISMSFLEGFSYTGTSRRRWRVIGNKYPNREELTGFPGSSNIGLNMCQENWVSLNKMLDEEEKYNHEFSLAVLIASASNPKGARGIRARHDASVQKINDRRKKLAQLGTVEKTTWTSEGWAAPVDTAEELVEELMRQIEGKKDRHDLFIEEHMKKIREEAEKQAKENEEKIEELRKKREEEGIGTAVTGSHRVLSPEESKKLESKKSNNLMIVGSEDMASEEEEKRYFNKIGSKVLTARK